MQSTSDNAAPGALICAASWFLLAAALAIAAYLSLLLGYGLWWNVTDAEGSALGAAVFACVWLCVPLAAALAWRSGRQRAESRDVLLRRIALTLIATSIPLMMLMSLVAVLATGI